MNKIILVFLVTLCSWQIAPKAEGLQGLSDILENKVKSVETGWKLASKRFEENVLIIKWQSSPPQNEEYFAIIRITPTDALAAKELTQDVSMASAGVGTKIQGIGQEAYLSQLNRGARIGITFRHANFVVKLTAPSEPQAKRYGKHIIDSIDVLRNKK